MYVTKQFCNGYMILCIYTATRTGVICLQDLCVETIARSVVSYEDVESLSLPVAMKDKVAKFVLNPSEDFMC